MIPTTEILIGDVRAKLLELKTRGTKVQTVVTSPPYWALRAYGTPPQVWGGNPRCAHVWQASGKLHRGGSQGATGERVTRDTSAQDETGDINTGQFCAYCSAWLGELGLEPTPELFVEHTVEVFRHVWDVLADNGTMWVNLGDSYVGNAGGYDGLNSLGSTQNLRISKKTRDAVIKGGRNKPVPGIKPKDLVGIPWMVAFALRADGWYLRQDIIWHKPSPMPESVKDRCTKAHEYLFLLTKSPRYYYDADAIKEPSSPDSHRRYARGRSADHKHADGMVLNDSRYDGMNRVSGVNPKAKPVSGWDTGKGAHDTIAFNRAGTTSDATKFPKAKQNASFSAAVKDLVDVRNKRSVWTLPAESYSGAHYATFPRDLVRPCVLAGSKAGDTVLDIFGGSGTTAAVALEYGRNAILIDLNPLNEALMHERIAPHAGQGVLNHA